MNLNQEALRYIRYLSFKMDCAREQEEEMWRLDYEKAKGHYEDLLGQQGEKLDALSKAMPKAPVYKEYKRPKNTHKKDGTLSSHGERWYSLLRENKFPATEKGPIKLVDHYVDGNPKSPLQIKNWLYSLGWKPTTWKYVRDKATGDERKIEQVNDDGELCESVRKLLKKDPAIEVLDGLTVINHRLGIFKGFLEHAIETPEGFFLQATMGGLTNTLRFKHRKPMTNIPGINSPYGVEIRGCLIAPEGFYTVGSDMVSLEDTTRRHYAKPLDPDLIEEESQPGFDPHLRLAVVAGMINKEELEFYRWYQESR